MIYAKKFPTFCWEDLNHSFFETPCIANVFLEEGIRLLIEAGLRYKQYLHTFEKTKCNLSIFSNYNKTDPEEYDPYTEVTAVIAPTG